MKKRVAEKYYKNKELVLKSLGCIWDLGSCVSLESLQFLLEKLHCEGFAVLIHKKLYEGLQFFVGDNISC